MLGKTTKLSPSVMDLPAGSLLKRGQFILHTALPLVHNHKSDFVGGMIRQMHREGKITDQQLQDFYQQRARRLDPLGLESHSPMESSKDV